MSGAAAACSFTEGVIPLTATDTPSNVSGYSNTGAVADITTSPVLANPVGGVAPYSYAWAQSGTSAETWTINTPATATTTFTAHSIGVGAIAFAFFIVTITDAQGLTATSEVTATVNNGRPYGPQPSQNNGNPGDGTGSKGDYF